MVRSSGAETYVGRRGTVPEGVASGYATGCTDSGPRGRGRCVPVHVRRSPGLALVLGRRGAPRPHDVRGAGDPRSRPDEGANEARPRRTRSPPAGVAFPVFPRPV